LMVSTVLVGGAHGTRWPGDPPEKSAILQVI
jgi:hypothetical protein